MMTAGMLLLLMFSFLAAAPVGAYCAPGGIGLCGEPPEPVWAALSATSQGNYPGGNEIFDVFIVNSDQPPDGNFTIFNETLTAPALPACCNTNTSIGLPLSLDPGQAILSAIHLEIPSNFTQSNFTADLVVNGALWNGTASIHLTLTGTTDVYLHSLAPAGTQPSTTSSTSQTAHTTVTITRSRGVPWPLFAVGVGILSSVVVMLLVLLARGRGRPRGGLITDGAPASP
jgi:hypothetical protein